MSHDLGAITPMSRQREPTRVFFNPYIQPDVRSQSPNTSSSRLEPYSLNKKHATKSKGITRRSIRNFEKDLQLIKDKLEKKEKKSKKRPIPRRYSLANCLGSSAQKYNLYSKKLENEYEVLVKVGDGDFGQVYKVKNKVSDRIYALKVLDSKFGKRRTINEVQMLSKIQRSNLEQALKYYQCWEEGNKFYYLMEFCRIDLKQRKKSNIKFTEPELRKIIRDMALILTFLHSNGIAHMDLKPENILIREQKQKSEKVMYLLADYSISVQVDENRQSEIIEGDARYLAPEMMCFGDFSDKDLFAVDIFALGMTIYELMTGSNLPSKGDEWHNLRSSDRIKENLRCTKYSEDLKELIYKCTSSDPNQRPKAKNIKLSFRSPSEVERFWLRLINKYLQNKERDLRESIKSQRHSLNATFN